MAKAIKFKMPTKSDLKSRTSTISNAFAISITPYLIPSKEEQDGYYVKFGISEGQCAYCLRAANGVDHFMPLVKGSMPTGYITDINNLVPCCSACNSSKGAKTFNEWYLSTENISRLKKNKMTDGEIRERYQLILHVMEQHIKKYDYQELVGSVLWEEYKKRKNALIELLKEDQTFCDELSKLIYNKIKK